LADLRQALTGFGILVRMLEHGDRPDPDHMDKAFKGDARVVLADGGPRITDRDLYHTPPFPNFGVDPSPV